MITVTYMIIERIWRQFNAFWVFYVIQNIWKQFKTCIIYRYSNDDKVFWSTFCRSILSAHALMTTIEILNNKEIEKKDRHISSNSTYFLPPTELK